MLELQKVVSCLMWVLGTLQQQQAHITNFSILNGVLQIAFKHLKRQPKRPPSLFNIFMVLKNIPENKSGKEYIKPKYYVGLKILSAGQW